MSTRFWGFGPNRLLCSVLEEMRKLHETRNYSVLLSLIEEAQVLGNRMEAALQDHSDLESARDHMKAIKEEIKELEKKRDDLAKKAKTGFQTDDAEEEKL